MASPTTAAGKAALDPPTLLDEGMLALGTVRSVFYEVERFEEAIHLNIYNSGDGNRIGYIVLDVIAAERVAREMLAEVAKIERILEAQAGAS